MELEEWLDAVSAEIGTDDFILDQDAIHTLLDLARDSAHEIERVAAPLTTFLVGVAVGRGEQLGAVAAKATALAMGLDQRTGSSTDDASP
jgi:hypothetical protein